MPDILEEIIAYLKSVMTLYASMDIDNFNTEDAERLMIRQGTGRPVVTRYMDGASAGRFSFAVYARSVNSATANDQLWKIQSALNLTEFQISDALMVTIEPTSNPSVISKRENLESVYIESFEIDYYKSKA